MKPTYSRRYRRRATASREAAIFKKDNQQEQPFFSAVNQQGFFKPSLVVSRKCAHCEAEEKNGTAAAEAKQTEKKLNRAEDKKEEKEIKRAAALPEEEKKIHKMGEKEEEKKLSRTAGKDEEKKLSRTAEKEEKEVSRTADEKDKEKKISKKQEANSIATSHSTSEYVHSLNGKGQVLPPESSAFFGDRMGYDFDHVKIHTDASAHQSAKDINAKAYTVDNHIVFNKSQYNPNSEEGRKLLAHELVHVMQNDASRTIRRKAIVPEDEKETSISITGTSHQPKNKSALGNCNIPDVNGQTDFNTLPSSFTVQGAKKKTSTECEACEAPDCITSSGTIVSTFKSKIQVTLPAVPDGLTPCETTAVRRFIRGTLNNHEQEHVRAFRTYNGTVRTPYTFTGCKADLQAHIQGIHDGIDAQRSADAIAKSDALDPFVVPIPCDCG